MHLNCIQLRGMLLPKPRQLCCMASTLQCCTLLSFCLGRCRRRPLLLQQLHALLPLRCGIQLQLPPLCRCLLLHLKACLCCCHLQAPLVLLAQLPHRLLQGGERAGQPSQKAKVDWDT